MLSSLLRAKRILRFLILEEALRLGSFDIQSLFLGFVFRDWIVGLGFSVSGLGFRGVGVWAQGLEVKEGLVKLDSDKASCAKLLDSERRRASIPSALHPNRNPKYPEPANT